MHINRLPIIWLKKWRFNSLGGGEAEKSDSSAFIYWFNRTVTLEIKNICHEASCRVIFVTDHFRHSMVICVSLFPELGSSIP